MNEVRRDIPRKAADEHLDAYHERLYFALADGEIANGWRRRGDALEHVGDYLEYLSDFNEALP